MTVKEGSEIWFRRMAEAYKAARRAMPERGPWDNAPDYLDAKVKECERLADLAKAKEQ